MQHTEPGQLDPSEIHDARSWFSHSSRDQVLWCGTDTASLESGREKKFPTEKRLTRHCKENATTWTRLVLEIKSRWDSGPPRNLPLNKLPKNLELMLWSSGLSYNRKHQHPRQALVQVLTTLLPI